MYCKRSSEIVDVHKDGWMYFINKTLNFSIEKHNHEGYSFRSVALQKNKVWQAIHVWKNQLIILGNIPNNNKRSKKKKIPFVFTFPTDPSLYRQLKTFLGIFDWRYIFTEDHQFPFFVRFGKIFTRNLGHKNACSSFFCFQINVIQMGFFFFEMAVHLQVCYIWLINALIAK